MPSHYARRSSVYMLITLLRKICTYIILNIFIGFLCEIFRASKCNDVSSAHTLRMILDKLFLFLSQKMCKYWEKLVSHRKSKLKRLGYEKYQKYGWNSKNMHYANHSEESEQYFFGIILAIKFADLPTYYKVFYNKLCIII